jgi:hypothetical protein
MTQKICFDCFHKLFPDKPIRKVTLGRQCVVCKAQTDRTEQMVPVEAEDIPLVKQIAQVPRRVLHRTERHGHRRVAVRVAPRSGLRGTALSAKTRSPATTRASPRTPAAGLPRPNRIGQPSDRAGTAMTPSTQHPAAARVCDLPGSQPGLDADRIDLYRHHRCLRALRRDTPRSRQRLRRGCRAPISSWSHLRCTKTRSTHRDADHYIANLSDGHSPRSRYPERRSTAAGDQPQPGSVLN